MIGLFWLDFLDKKQEGFAMKFLNSFNKFMEKWMPLVTPTSLVIGVLLEPYIGKYIFIVPWAFAFMTFSGSLGSGFGEMKKVALNPLPLIIVMFILHVWMPLIAFGVGKLLYANNPYFITGILLVFVVPTGITSLVWVAMYRGNNVLGLSIILIDTLTAPFVIPFSLKLLVGTAVELNTLGMFKDLILMILVPALLAMTLNQLTKGNIKKTLAPKLAPFSKAAIVVVVSLNSTKIAPYFRDFHLVLLGIAITILLLAISGYVWGWLASRIMKSDYADTVAITVNAGMRNIATGAVLASQYFPAAVMFPAMVGTLFQQVLVSFVTAILSKSEKKKINNNIAQLKNNN